MLNLCKIFQYFEATGSNTTSTNNSTMPQGPPVVSIQQPYRMARWVGGVGGGGRGGAGGSAGRPGQPGGRI